MWEARKETKEKELIHLIEGRPKWVGQVLRKPKSWSQNLEDKDIVFNRIYIDYTDAEKTKPCSITFKTDNIELIWN